MLIGSKPPNACWRNFFSAASIPQLAKKRASGRAGSRSINRLKDRKNIFQPQDPLLAIRTLVGVKATGLANNRFPCIACIDRLLVSDLRQIYPWKA